MTRIEELKALEHLKRRILKLCNDNAADAESMCHNLRDEFHSMQVIDFKRDAAKPAE
jgi:hypothetical protein